jgi:hypothetical protein
MDCHSYYITKLEKKEKEKKKSQSIYLYLEDNENEKVHVREEHQLSLVQSLDYPLGIKDAQNTCLLVYTVVAIYHMKCT